MEIKHTHRTNQIRTDYELAAMEVMRIGCPPDMTLDMMEEQYRGRPEYERTMKDVAGWLEGFRSGFKAIPHVCIGQGCS